MARRIQRNCLSITVLLCIAGVAQNARAAGPVSAAEIARRPDAWYATAEARQTVDHILSWQTAVGGWAKAYDISRPRAGNEAFGTWEGVSTIDNAATYSELRVLARSYAVAPRPEVLTAFNRGLDALLAAQYSSGGWSQRFPPNERDYGKHITFNDDAMVGVMRLLRDVTSQPHFAFVDPVRRDAAKVAFSRGVECILKCQIVIDGKPTGWCAQHDRDTFAPAAARAYELPSISGAEGAGVVLLLMEIEKPDARVRHAIKSAAAWFDRAKVVGKRIDERPDPDRPGKRNLILVDDSKSTIWARFYDLKTGQPFFSDRQGRVLTEYADIPQERRDGYRWFGKWGERVVSEFEKWKTRNPEPAAQVAPQHAPFDIAADGSGKFSSVQAAFDSIAPGSAPVTFRVAPGRYVGVVRLDRSKPRVTLVGLAGCETVLSYNLTAKSVDESGKLRGTSGSATVTIDAADFTAENITFENFAGDIGQAVALKVTGDRAVFRNCRFVGWQDTLCADSNGRSYFVDCHIEGRVDFIFGRSTAVFERCTLRSKDGGYITAASTALEKPWGYVFLDCTLVGDDVPTFLGRPWRPNASVTFVRCNMDKHIRPQGWDNWRKTENEATARFAEVDSTGPGANPTARVTWARKLMPNQTADLTAANILRGRDGWDPTQR